MDEEESCAQVQRLFGRQEPVCPLQELDEHEDGPMAEISSLRLSRLQVIYSWGGQAKKLNPYLLARRRGHKR